MHLSLYLKQDANITLSDDQKVVKYIEVERLIKQRYFGFSDDPEIFQQQFKKYALPQIETSEIKTISTNRISSAQLEVLRKFFPTTKTWIDVDHYIAHIWSAYNFTTPKENDLIICFDGTSDVQDPFRVYSFLNNKVNHLESFALNLGTPYRSLGVISPELNGSRELGYRVNLALAGKVMALVALGNFNEKMRDALSEYYHSFRRTSAKEAVANLLCRLGLDVDQTQNNLVIETQAARDILATSQAVFEEIFLSKVHKYLADEKFQRIIIVGGCALNVLLNQRIYETYAKPVFVPPCPNDSGISLGATKSLNPHLEILKSAANGLVLSDANVSATSHKRYPAKAVSCADLAFELSQGRIIGVIQGNMEMGPRALGNRSVLASPLTAGIKDSLNKIKAREYFRPVAPVVTDEQYSVFFETSPPSPYMSFAPKIKKEFREALKEVSHYDGTARVQSVSEQDGFIYKLCKAFGQITGFEMLINTSFNSKGRPILNDLDEALELAALTNIDAVYCNGMLFETKVALSESEFHSLQACA